jgi:hypothetical protein
LGKQVLRFRRLGIAAPGRIQRSLELNRLLVNAVKDRNTIEATRIVEQIVSEGITTLRALLNADEKNEKTGLHL